MTGLDQSRWLKITAAFFFGLPGAFLTLVLLVATPSFWYLPCAALWTLSSLAWMLQPTWAASFCTIPVLGISAFLFQIRSGLGNQSALHENWMVLASTIGAAICITAVLISSKSISVVPLSLSLAIIAAGFAVDRLFTHQIQVKTFEVEWSTNGSVPWGVTETVDQPVTIYRRVGGGYCYDSFNSAELRQRLTANHMPTIKAQYNMLRNFGKVTGYSVRSVDGLLLDDGHRVVEDALIGGGQMLIDGPAVDCQQ